MQNIWLSIIIPCYNVQDFILKTLSSVLSQTYSCYEIIIVDDGSYDSTYEIVYNRLQNLPNCKIIKKINGGVSSARNVGLHHAVGKYVYFLDGDDIIEENFIESIKLNLQDEDITLVGYSKEIINHKKQLYLPSKSKNYIKEYLSGKLYICMSSIILKKDFLVENSIIFDENTHYSEDREFIAKALYKAKQIKIIEKVLFHYIYRVGSAMNTADYTERRSTSLNAMERVYHLFEQDKTLANLALIQLQTTILLHYKMVYNSCHFNSIMEDKIKVFFNNYISLPVKFLWNKFSLYVCVFKFLYQLNPKLFHILLTRKI